ncbi:Rad21/Rec8-like protein, N-terminal [Dillenia turbinata]|uniref:Rad21/Rec8-like protein, N-terminal n=1 Tax=Dillenia turbinata TaxID=194707 RepID=A0AAN8VF80_9MAGN
MFYSHQLLARKAPLGQIWMAATMHAKMNRRKLNKLDIISICEQILNPSVPMALRLSGILMGGVVIVYERKVKLLYDDVTRLLVEINEAWKVKTISDPTLLPKGKSQAKYEAVTLPDNMETEIGDIEQSVAYSDTTTMMGFQRTAYVAMRLDSVDETYTNNNIREENLQHLHQADADHITLFEPFDLGQTDNNLYDRFERFDIEGDEETNLNFPSQEHQVPDTLVPSPPQNEPPQADEIHDHYPEQHVNQQPDNIMEADMDRETQQNQGLVRKKPRRAATLTLDYEQTVTPSKVFQSWLQDSSDIVARRGKKRKSMNLMSTAKIAHVFNLPPVGLICGLVTGHGQIHYPAPLLQLWMKHTRPLPSPDSFSGRDSHPQPPQPSLSVSPPKGMPNHDEVNLPFEDIHNGYGTQSLPRSQERLRQEVRNSQMSKELFMKTVGLDVPYSEVRAPEATKVVTPGNSGDSIRSIPSAGSAPGDILQHSLEATSGRSSKKRIHSSRHSMGGLDTVSEEFPWAAPEPDWMLAEDGQRAEHELLVETGPTQTQLQTVNQPMDQMTDSLRKHFKTHFDTPGASQVESLNKLAFGMDRRKAAQLFYQTCVLATRDFLRVEQKAPYAEIIISRGTKL